MYSQELNKVKERTGMGSSLEDIMFKAMANAVLALDLEGVHDVKLHHPSSSVATSNQ